MFISICVCMFQGRDSGQPLNALDLMSKWKNELADDESEENSGAINGTQSLSHSSSAETNNNSQDKCQSSPKSKVCSLQHFIYNFSFSYFVTFYSFSCFINIWKTRTIYRYTLYVKKYTLTRSIDAEYLG